MRTPTLPTRNSNSTLISRFIMMRYFMPLFKILTCEKLSTELSKIYALFPASLEGPKQKLKVDKIDHRNQHLTLASPYLPHPPIPQPARNSPPKSTSPFVCPPVDFCSARVQSLPLYLSSSRYPPIVAIKYTVSVYYHCASQENPVVSNSDPLLGNSLGIMRFQKKLGQPVH